MTTDRWLVIGVFLLFILFLAHSPILSLRCPSNCIRHPRNGHSYCLTPEGLSWPEAEAFARLKGGHLVTINDAAEQVWLVKTFGGDRWMWMGFTDVDREGKWRWVSGRLVTFTNWHWGEPNNSHSGEHYACMNWGNPGEWNDLGPSSLEWFQVGIGIIEIP